MSIVDPIVVDERVALPDAEIALIVPDGLEYFKGHFPGAPIVPGVVQIKWVLQLAGRCLGLSGAFAGMEALKFHQVMTPGTRVTLALKWAARTQKLHFCFESEQCRYSSGRLMLRSTE